MSWQKSLIFYYDNISLFANVAAGWKTLTNCHHKTCGPDQVALYRQWLAHDQENQDSCCEISASVEEEFNIGLGSLASFCMPIYPDELRENNSIEVRGVGGGGYSCSLNPVLVFSSFVFLSMSYMSRLPKIWNICVFSVKINISTTGGSRVGFFQPDTNHP